MTVLERVRDLIVRLAPGAACDDCIAHQLRISPRQHANHKTRELEKAGGFDRRVNECSICKCTNKKVVRYRISP
jgi:hypothetical protein